MTSRNCSQATNHIGHEVLAVLIAQRGWTATRHQAVPIIAGPTHQSSSSEDDEGNLEEEGRGQHVWRAGLRGLGGVIGGKPGRSRGTFFKLNGQLRVYPLIGMLNCILNTPPRVADMNARINIFTGQAETDKQRVESTPVGVVELGRG